MRLVFEKWEFNSYWIVDVTLFVIGYKHVVICSDIHL